MMEIPSDIHSQIVDSYTQMPVTIGAVPTGMALAQTAYKQHPSNDIQVCTEHPVDMRERLSALEMRRTRALSQRAELERSMSAQRVEISRWSNHLSRERKKMLNDVEIFRVLDADDVRWDMYHELQNHIEKSDVRDRICDFMQQRYNDEEQSFCQLVEKMKHKYPMYQIRSTNTIAEAIDSLVCTAEVCMEDANLVSSAINSTQQSMRELREKNKQLTRQIEQLENSLSDARNFYLAIEQPDQRQLEPRHEDSTMNNLTMNNSVVGKSDYAGFNDTDSKRNASKSCDHENARMNVLDLTLESVKTRQYRHSV